jgi:outer membrane protein TolC
MRPRLDVQASLTQGSRGSYMRDVFEGIGEIDDAFEGIWRGLPEQNDTTYSFGLTGSVPIGNRSARASHQRARLTLRQAEQRLEKARQDIALGVQLAARGVKTSRVLVLSNQNTRTLQETNVIAEEKRLRLGVTTSYRVLQVQEDLTSAQTQELQALISFQKALVDLRLAEGTLLEENGVEFEYFAPEPPEGFLQSLVVSSLP